MGLFSWLCAKSRVSIPTPFVDCDPDLRKVVLVTPNNRKIKGEYDGYGRIDGKDVFVEVTRDLVDDDYTDEELRRNFFRSVSYDNIKIVTQEYYKGEDFNELESSDSCPHQGYFYPEDYEFGEGEGE